MTTKKWLLSVLGFALLGLGAVGAVLPLLPTTPFVLLAFLCFSISSERASARLRQSRFFGPYIENYRTKQGIAISQKIISLAFLWAGLTASMLAARKTWLYIALGLVGAGVTLHLLLIKTKKPDRAAGRTPAPAPSPACRSARFPGDRCGPGASES
ncbi:MAG: YbaN family protein [Oscillospiraceae bacterium]|nr:YbaN family protein [Oscillospiraceae bacterium]